MVAIEQQMRWRRARQDGSNTTAAVGPRDEGRRPERVWRRESGGHSERQGVISERESEELGQTEHEQFVTRASKHTSRV